MNKKMMILTLLLSFSVSAKELAIGRVESIKGTSFMAYDGATKEIKKGDIIYEGVEVVVDHKGQLVITDNFDHRYILGKETSVVVEHKNIKLRSGDVWVQSLNKVEKFQIETANALIVHDGGEAILTYDTSKAKTQLMVISGMMDLKNYQTKELAVSVSEGNFSYIDNYYDQGAPRNPTPVGASTFKSVLSLFEGVKPLDSKSLEHLKKDDEKHDRKIASVSTQDSHHTKDVIEKKGTVLEIENTALEEYKKDILEKKLTNKSEKKLIKKEKLHYSHVNKAEDKVMSSKLVVEIFGQKKKEASSASHRVPASVEPEVEPVQNQKVIEENIYKKTNETEKLLEKLNSI